MPRLRKPASPFRYFNSSSEVIRLMVLIYVRFPLSQRNVEGLLFERGIDMGPKAAGSSDGRTHHRLGFWRLWLVRDAGKRGWVSASPAIGRTAP